MSVSEAVIKRYCNKRTFDKGYHLFVSDRVIAYGERTNTQLGLEYLKGKVRGSHVLPYEVTGIYRGEDDTIYDYTCTCEAYKTYQGICKHCVALFLTYLHQQRKYHLVEEEQPSYSNNVQLLLQQYAMRNRTKYLQPDVTRKLTLEPLLYRENQNYFLECKIGRKQKYIIKNLDEFVQALQNGLPLSFGKNLSFVGDFSVFTPQSERLARFLCHTMEEEVQVYSKFMQYGYGKEFSHGRKLQLYGRTLEQYMTIMSEEEVSYESILSPQKRRLVLLQNPDIFVTMKEVDEVLQIKIPFGECLFGETVCMLCQGETIYVCSKEFSEDMKPFFLLAKNQTEVGFHLVGEEKQTFCKAVLPVLRKHCILNDDEVELEKYTPEPCECKVFLEMNESKEIVASLRAYYGNQNYDIVDGFTEATLSRDIEKEGALLEIAFDYFERTDSLLAPMKLREEEDTLYLLLKEGIVRMNAIATVYMDEKVRALRIHKSHKMNIGLTLGPRLLELKMVTDAFPKEEIEDLIQSYRRRKKFYRMKNGDFMQIEDSSMETIADLYEGLSLTKKSFQEDVVLLPKYRALFIDHILKEHSSTVEVKRNTAFKALLRDMKAIEDSDYEVPSLLEPILRSYQKTGFRWLCTLDRLGFGGVLADDMGLGKTLQVIALLLYKKEQGELEHKALIVCPASLVYNWEEELQRFAPILRVQMVVGSFAERTAALQSEDEVDVYITSYDLLKRDTVLYEGREFALQVIDEAQAIKNHTTQAAKAVKEIVAYTKFALTGTPIENRLEELWSIFDYLMPGILYSYTKFRKEMELPIVLKKDLVIANRLQQMIKPFILRRLKEDVLKELPEKEEHVVFAKLEKEQLALYSAHVQKLKRRLAEQSPEEFKNTKIQTLAELTKLRQLCCDPSLLYEEYRGGAAKVETCIELVKNAVESGHKVLLFSQFTSMLTIIENRLNQEEISYFTLTGQTKKEKRMQMVREFQKDDTSVFLISLKAGGTGLNLTKASIVIHFDPWWNLAAENQATDRTHRIGQEKNVTVYKIIAKDTIEENILGLQKRKKNLADQIISEDGVSIQELTKEDFMHLFE